MTQPHIVVADGLTTTQNDLDWSSLEALGSVTTYERCGPELVARCREADVVLTNKEVFDEDVLRRLPRLKFISVLATGTNVVDLDAAHRCGIAVSNVPSYSTDSVTQHVFALLLELNNRVSEHAAACRDGRWSRSGRFSNPLLPISELAHKTFGIVGFGHIGQGVALVAAAFGMKVLVATSHRAKGNRDDPRYVQRVDLDELFRSADVLSLHCPLTQATRRLVDARRLGTMKPTAILINTGRGPLVDEAALADALHTGKLRGAGLDVLSQEPPPEDHPLLTAPNCLITPHLAWASVEARRRLLEQSVENVAAFLSGRPKNLVTPA